METETQNQNESQTQQDVNTTVTQDNKTDVTPREEALQNTLNKYIVEHKKLKDELYKLKVSNEELALKVGLNRGTTEDVLKCFSKYYRGENNGRKSNLRSC